MVWDAAPFKVCSALQFGDMVLNFCCSTHQIKMHHTEVNLRQSGESLEFSVRRKPSPFVVYVQKRLCATRSVAASEPHCVWCMI
jgi:hypothetical protein